MAVGGKNILMNSDFAIWQKGTVWDKLGNYFCDRWRTSNLNDSAEQVAVAGAPFSSRWMLKYFSGSSGATIQTSIEGGIEITAGKKVTLSFWVRSDSNVAATVKLIQNFDGGSNISTSLVNSNITSEWVKYEDTVELPFTDTNTFSDNDRLKLEIAFDSGNTFLYFAEVKLEVGESATEYQVQTHRLNYQDASVTL